MLAQEFVAPLQLMIVPGKTTSRNEKVVAKV